MSSDRRNSIYGLFKKPGSSGSNNNNNTTNNEDDRALKLTRTNSTASTTPSSAATPARGPTTSLSPARSLASPTDLRLASPSKLGLSITQSFSPIQEHPGSPLDEKVKSPFLGSRKHSDRPQYGTAQSSRRQDSVRKDTTSSTLRSMTLGHGGHVHDVPVNPRSSLQLLHDTSAKRIATLDYLRRTHEGTVYWLNTLHLPQSSLHKLPSFASRKLARRAQNHLVLGISIPAMLDPLHSSTPTEYLRTLHDLLTEFETYQDRHSPDGHPSGSLGRTRLPAMFKRSNMGIHATKPKRSASGSAAEALALSPPSVDDLQAAASRSFSTNSFPSSATSFGGSATPLTSSFASSFTSDSTSSDLLPHEFYNLLLTPSLPFDPDYFETFATLAEVLIDVYLRVLELVKTPEACSPVVEGLFAAVDKRIRKVMLEGLVKEVGEMARSEVRSEVAGVGRLVLGGLA